MDEFKVFLTFDIDQDFNPDSVDYYNRSNANFESFEKQFISLVRRLELLPFSVFIRSDFQINKLYGSYDYLLKNKDLIDKIFHLNGEINWHIHLYEQIENEWTQIKNEKKLVESFLIDYEQVRNIKKINSDVVRIGECVMTNSLMNAIDNCGIKIDSSALPGRKRNDSEKFFDWELTKNNVYKPSKKDFRVEGDGINEYSVKEVPMSTLLMKASYDDKPIKRYFNLAFNSDVLFQNFDNYVQNHDMLVTITHPFEVLHKANHELISYNIEMFSENLKTLKNKVQSNGKKIVFKKISDLI